MNILLFKEGLHIKEKNPTVNNGLKASRKLELFFRISQIWLIQLIFVCLLTFNVTYCKFWSVYSNDEIVSISKHKSFYYFKRCCVTFLLFNTLHSEKWQTLRSPLKTRCIKKCVKKFLVALLEMHLLQIFYNNFSNFLKSISCFFHLFNGK